MVYWIQDCNSGLQADIGNEIAQTGYFGCDLYWEGTFEVPTPPSLLSATYYSQLFMMLKHIPCWW